MSSHNQKQINEAAAEAMRAADDLQQEYPTEEPSVKSAEERRRDEVVAEAAADAMRRADDAYECDDDEL